MNIMNKGIEEETDNLKQIKKAHYIIKQAYEGQKRKTEELYVIHPVRVAEIAKKYGADIDTICACILHHILEDRCITLNYIEKEFGPITRFLVAGVTEESNLEKTFEKVKSFSEGIDKRIVLIKLADMIYNTATINNDRIRAKYGQINPKYIELGKKLGYGNMARELKNLTDKKRHENERKSR